MMRRAVLLPILMLLGACVPGADVTSDAMGQPAPVRLRLTHDRLSLQLSDGTLCRLENWQARPAGRLERCGPGYGYAIRVEDRPGLARRLAEGVDMALSGGRLLAPMAEVVITDPAGIDHVFRVPPANG